MQYSTAEISELAIGQLLPSELQVANEAFNGFADLFGREWIDNYFRGCHFPGHVLELVSLWQDWSLVRRLAGAEKLQERWRSGVEDGGVRTEVRVVAHFLRAGATVELFPVIGSGKVPDFRFQADSNVDWVYAEASMRGISNVRRLAQQTVTRVSEAAGQVVPGMHGKVAVLRQPSSDELETMVSWLATLTSPDETRLDDLAVFFAAPLEDNTEDRIDQLVPLPRFFSTSFSSVDGLIRQRGTAWLSALDNAAQQVLEAEASQLPKDSPAMVFLDLSSVAGGYRAWESLIEKRFSPLFNTRISAVVLFQHNLSVDTVQGRVCLKTEGRLIVNPHAKKTLPSLALRPVQSMFHSVDIGLNNSN
jgi:hypothetical protein